MNPSNPLPQNQELSSEQLRELTLRGCQTARSSAEALLEGLKTGSEKSLDLVRQYEEELDALDRQINEGVTTAIPRVSSESQARELLACLKFILELERIGDLLLNVVNRLRSVGSRLHPFDVGELSRMTGIVANMLRNVAEAFTGRDVPRALAVLRDDAELDRLRNLMFVRHVENPERQPVRESYHLVFMSQTLERAGDHAKNLAEEVVHLATGRSVRHVMRDHDKPIELMAMERLKGNRGQEG
jgi:phosphate transport system protein